MRWTFPYLEACEHAGDQVVETGDLLALEWRGALLRPRLAPIGEGLRAIVTRVDERAGIRHQVEVANLDPLPEGAL